MLPIIAILGLFAAQPVQAPMVGRPIDFSGAIGGPFRVSIEVEPKEVAVEEPFTLTLRIEGPGNLKDIERPALGKLESFASFDVENSGDTFTDGPTPRRDFQYRLRVRKPGVREVPGVRFVYFNPAVRSVNHGFQTHLTHAVALRIKPRRERAQAVPEFILREWADDDARYFGPASDGLLERVSNWLPPWIRLPAEDRARSGVTWIALALLPIAACGGWYLIARRLQRPLRRRSDDATSALRKLTTPGVVRPVLTDFLRSRQAPCEEYSTELVERTSAILRRADEWAYSGQPSGGADLVADARRLILDWEDAP